MSQSVERVGGRSPASPSDGCVQLGPTLSVGVGQGTARHPIAIISMVGPGRWGRGVTLASESAFSAQPYLLVGKRQSSAALAGEVQACSMQLPRGDVGSSPP